MNWPVYPPAGGGGGEEGGEEESHTRKHLGYLLNLGALPVRDLCLNIQMSCYWMCPTEPN